MIAIFISSILVVLSSLFGSRFKVLRSCFVVLFSFVSFIITAYYLKLYLAGELTINIISLKFGFFDLEFGLDLWGLIFACLITLLWGIASTYSFSYMQANYPDKKDDIFQLCYSLSVFFAICFAFAKNLITMFIIYECLTLATIALVGFKRNEEVKKGLLTYLIVLFVCSFLLLLPAILYIQFNIGTITFTGMGDGFIHNFGIDEITLKILLAMLVLGVGKAAFFPFHIWLPSAMVAPTPVSGLLHAVAVVKVGAFFVLRIINDVYGVEFLSHLLSSFNFIMIIASVSIVFSSTMAVFQVNLKKRLAFSTIGQISYVVLAFSTFTPLGIVAGMFQIITHALTKILLFFTVGGFYTAAHSNQIVAFTGMFRRHKIVCIAFLFATLSICGLPFTAGFLNKGFLLYALIKAESYMAVCVLGFSAFLSFLYLIPVCYAIFKQIPKRQAESFEEIPITFNVIFILLAILNIIVFILGSVFFISYVNEW